MKYLIMTSLIFGSFLMSYSQQGQRQRPNYDRMKEEGYNPNNDSLLRMNHFMTEIWEPEVPLVQTAEKAEDAPSDAIVLFDGTDIDKEWEETAGYGPNSGFKPATWIIQEGAPLQIFGNSVVIDTQTKTATIKVLSCRDALRIGDLVQDKPH